jgi:hypothetical protein
MVTCEHCGKSFNPSDGAWDDGDYVCGDCIAGYVETSERSGQKNKQGQAKPSRYFHSRPSPNDPKRHVVERCLNSPAIMGGLRGSFDGQGGILDLIESKRSEIAAAMKRLRRKLESGDDSELLVWIIPNALACGHRPLRHHPHFGGSGLPIPSEAKPFILDWIEQIRLEGIASIISFMHERDLRCYREIDLRGLNLIGFLGREGFQICPLPWEDPAHRQDRPGGQASKT